MTICLRHSMMYCSCCRSGLKLAGCSSLLSVHFSRWFGWSRRRWCRFITFIFFTSLLAEQNVLPLEQNLYNIFKKHGGTRKVFDSGLTVPSGDSGVCSWNKGNCSTWKTFTKKVFVTTLYPYVQEKMFCYHITIWTYQKEGKGWI